MGGVQESCTYFGGKNKLGMFLVDFTLGLNISLKDYQMELSKNIRKWVATVIVPLAVRIAGWKFADINKKVWASDIVDAELAQIEKKIRGRVYELSDLLGAYADYLGHQIDHLNIDDENTELGKYDKKTLIAGLSSLAVELRGASNNLRASELDQMQSAIRESIENIKGTIRTEDDTKKSPNERIK
ncbi:MAG: hypothetical protein R3E73_03310 [Porticoccaceae bacterium]|nr:hypothetical protein [Pseudomonadales bacterium]MCP5172771.1 hypothetical protein [Pseudomonadales bacterium]MCP5302245.1 hypothetical protein [Pseudomonadales bacterium]